MTTLSNLAKPLVRNRRPVTALALAASALLGPAAFLATLGILNFRHAGRSLEQDFTSAPKVSARTGMFFTVGITSALLSATLLVNAAFERHAINALVRQAETDAIDIMRTTDSEGGFSTTAAKVTRGRDSLAAFAWRLNTTTVTVRAEREATDPSHFTVRRTINGQQTVTRHIIDDPTEASFVAAPERVFHHAAQLGLNSFYDGSQP
jgi:hypothetical protein